MKGWKAGSLGLKCRLVIRMIMERVRVFYISSPGRMNH
jgi:hypothetical protein